MPARLPSSKRAAGGLSKSTICAVVACVCSLTAATMNWTTTKRLFPTYGTIQPRHQVVRDSPNNAKGQPFTFLLTSEYSRVQCPTLTKKMYSRAPRLLTQPDTHSHSISPGQYDSPKKTKQQGWKWSWSQHCSVLGVSGRCAHYHRIVCPVWSDGTARNNL